MTIFPLLAPDSGEPDYLTLEEALAARAIEITEINKNGSVPELKLINHGTMNVLILEAEVAFSLKQARGYQADQFRVWSDIAEKGSRLGVKSPTGAAADLFEQQEDILTSYLKKFRPVDCQVGAVFAINGRVAGMDCYFYQDTFCKFFSKLVTSYALDAIDWYQGDPTGKVSQDKAHEFLKEVKKAPKESHPSLGLGTDFRFVTGRLAGSSLVHGETLLHLAAFALDEAGGKLDRVPFSRFSDRQRRRH
jgi:hypothetical protein